MRRTSPDYNRKSRRDLSLRILLNMTSSHNEAAAREISVTTRDSEPLRIHPSEAKTEMALLERHLFCNCAVGQFSPGLC